MKLNLDEIANARQRYQANMRRLAELDRQLAAYHRLRDALRAHRADPCNVTWRSVLEALRKVEASE